MYIYQKLMKYRYVRIKKRYDITDILLYMMFALMILCAFRPLHTTDTQAYYDYYINADVSSPHPELSYVLLSVFCRNVLGGMPGFRLLFLTYYVIAFLLVSKIIRNSSVPLFALAVYFSFAFALQICIQVRSAAANLLLLSALNDISQRDVKKYYVKVFFAFLIHSSGIVYLAVYPACCLLDKMRSRIVFAVLPFVSVAAAKLVSFSVVTLLDFAISRGIHDLARYKIYFEGIYAQQKINPLNRISIMLFLIYFVFLAAAGVKQMSRMEAVYLAVMCYSIFFYFLGYYSIALIGFRFPETLNLVLVHALPDLLGHFRGIWKSAARYFLLAYLVLINMQYETVRIIMSCLDWW